MKRIASLLLGLGLLVRVPGHSASRPEPPSEAFEESITVALDTLVVRAVDATGQPILGLKPEDFRVRVRGVEIPVASVDWVSSETGAGPAEAIFPEVPGGEMAFPAEPAPGKRVVLFVQADLNPTRISGQMRMRPYTRELLATLHPSDRVAVVSFDSHLKLWLDFTGDREAVLDAVDLGVVYSPERTVRPAVAPSLAATFDSAAARSAASPERALEVTAKALLGVPGEKTMIYLGWGLGSFGSGGVRMTPSFEPAVAALTKARVSVFVLDVTSADSHSLEAGLQNVAAATGGTYASTFRLPGLATTRLARAISGWYVLTFDRDALEGFRPGQAVIELRGRRGEVLARPVTLH